MKRPLTEIAAEILRLPNDEIDLGRSLDDIDTWDSLNHLLLISAVETEYEVRLSMDQIKRIKCLRDLAEFVDPQQT